MTDTAATTARESHGIVSKRDGIKLRGRGECGRTYFDNEKEAHEDEVRHSKKRALASDCKREALGQQEQRGRVHWQESAHLSEFGPVESSDRFERGGIVRFGASMGRGA